VTRTCFCKGPAKSISWYLIKMLRSKARSFNPPPPCQERHVMLITLKDYIYICTNSSEACERKEPRDEITTVRKPAVSCSSAKERFYSATNVFKIEEEGVVAEHALLLPQLDVRDVLIARTLERRGNFALLPGRKQNVAGDTQH